MNRFKIFLVMVVSMFVFGVGSFATVYVNTKELEKDGVVIIPNQSTREDTTVVHFADVDWYVIGTDGESKITLLLQDTIMPEWYTGNGGTYTNAVTYASQTGDTVIANKTVATRTLINASGNIEYDLAEPQEEISNKRLYLLSKSEAENVSSDIRRNIMNWYTRDGYYSYPEGFETNGKELPLRPSVTVDVSNVDLSTGFYNGDTSKKVLYIVNRGDIASNKATNVNSIPVTIGDITITPNQGTNQIIKLGDYSFYPIGSNGEDKVTLILKGTVGGSVWNRTTLYGKEYPYNNYYYTSAANALINSWIYGAPEGYTANMDLSTFVDAMDSVLLNDVRTPNGLDEYYQSEKLFILSRYEVADVNINIRKQMGYLRSRSIYYGASVGLIYNGGKMIYANLCYTSGGYNPTLVLNLDKVNLSSTTSNGVETITVTMK